MKEMQMITGIEASQILHISRSKLNDMVRDGLIGHYKIGKTVKFEKKEVEDYFRKCRIVVKS